MCTAAQPSKGSLGGCELFKLRDDAILMHGKEKTVRGGGRG